MEKARLRVGIVGLQPGRSWAARAHIPALRALGESFELAGVANSSLQSAEQAAAACGIPRASGSVDELVACPDIDIVAVTVKVPHHLDLVSKAARAGKHIYCEWPLGNGLAEAEEMAALVGRQGVMGVVGTQARVAPGILKLRKLVADGYVGDVLSTSIVARGRAWGAAIDSRATGGYMLDRANGATMLTIPMGHALAAFRDVLGEIAEVSAVTATRRTEVLAKDTGETLPMTAPDQVVLSGLLQSGAPLSIHYRGGEGPGTGFIWEINGTRGDLRVTAANGHIQMAELTLEGATEGQRSFERLELPAVEGEPFPAESVPGNVARMYARMAADLNTGTRTATTFDDAVGLHRVIAAVEEADRTGARVAVAGVG
ncbi:Gfo/Idh/MocA family protein [Ancylobacter polymorphus]|uniref:Gfo/Idh/MocA family oxidoreductase n=1 Tax=Ancylobacter polymorphus TaxID=223390 RepID=A0A9E6ZX20_9HYPH|nr:Gfo/Idh/MocA family oxidoreductase [Ancylobacter polymorphus]UOK73319.1 Gfo/Idh/MocA family oxidoreductase [Ancylobacter polymorphus]